MEVDTYVVEVDGACSNGIGTWSRSPGEGTGDELDEPLDGDWG